MNYYGQTTAELTQREMRHAALARKAAAESFVLLKNDGVLPIGEKKIALYGMGARKTVSGGEGSGEVAPRYKITVEQGLENAGLTVTSKAWLDDYDKEFGETYEAFRTMVEEQIASIPNPIAQIPAAHSYKYRYPSGRLINERDVKESDTDTAVYVLMRQAGECNDRKNEPGDFELTETEIENLRYVAEHYSKVTLVINVGGLVDLSPLDSIPGIGAVVFYVQGGMEGGNALADVLTGKQNFCGRLADTWPISYSQIPCGGNYSSLNGELENEYYTEGRYVGYRYYDSFSIEPRYPFGFGLSYTTFSREILSVELDGKSVTARVKVTNTGSVPGKEVVQGYIHVPGGVYQSLCAFSKTDFISPGEEETVTLSFDLSDCAQWEESISSWVLPAGEYPLMIGRHSRDTETAAVFTLAQPVTVKECRSCCAPEIPVEELDAPAIALDFPAGVKRIAVEPAAFVTEHVSYALIAPFESEWVRKTLDSLTVQDMIELHRGGDLQNQSAVQHQIMGAGGKTCITLADKGIPNVVFSDGPAGVNIMEEVVYGSDGSQKTAKMPDKYNWGLMRKMASRFIGQEGQHVYRYATAWPVEELLAQSWDTGLLEEIGKAVGEELREFGITLWLAPGMNIHRNPLCGRTFEYYSEDPVITGNMAAALTRGVQSHGGVGVTLKHFCCNNQEDNRLAVSSNVGERALREIYLKGFEIAVREKPVAIMTSYNKLNGQYTGTRKDLIGDILRCEWGFDGLVMTDWGTLYDPLQALNATTDLMMPGCDKDRDTLLAALESGELDTKALRRSAARVLTVVEQGITGEE